MTLTRKQIKERAARFVKFVEWSEEDRCSIGRCPSLFGVGTHGDDEAVVYAEHCRLGEEWVELLHQDGTPLPEPTADRHKYSGKFVLRVEPDVHRRLALKAVAAGESLNSYCAKTLAQA